MPPALVMDMRIMFCTNCTWVARDTAAMESWAMRPSMMASPAATAASIRLCREMGTVKWISF